MERKGECAGGRWAVADVAFVKLVGDGWWAVADVAFVINFNILTYLTVPHHPRSPHSASV